MAHQTTKADAAYAEALRRIETCHKRQKLDDTLHLKLGDTLDLAYLGLESLPPEIGQLTSLTKLDLSFNELNVLPSQIGSLRALTELYFENNPITMLPQEIGQLKALTDLYLRNNQLATLPPEIGQLTALTTLYLQGNKLTTLPSEIGQLTALTTLYLQSNKLTKLPPEVGLLTRLTEVYLADNLGLEFLTEMLANKGGEPVDGSAKQKTPCEILGSYFSIDRETADVLGECRLIVVGRGQAGKTSLVKRLSGKPFDPFEAETHGITIQSLDFQGNRSKVIGRVWDFGGQVVLHSMHEFFFTARCLYLLVLGERDDMLERDAIYWLQLIRSYAGDAPVVVALNKSAGRERHFDRATLEQNYGPILGWVATECSQPDDAASGVSLLRRTLTAAIESPHLDSVWRKFPRKWRAIKTELESMKESYLDYAEYVEKCRRLGETDPKEQEALAADLHDLGIALNYGRNRRLRDARVFCMSETGALVFRSTGGDPRLQSTTVLRPDWLANGIYAVLRANDLDKMLPPELNVPLAPDGVINSNTLVRILEKARCLTALNLADYPTERQDFLLRLMDVFHLSYPLKDQVNSQLVPTLLPLNPPEGTEEPGESPRLRLRYEFEVVPAPLLPWFISRTFSLIPNRLHWRRGAVLVYGEARARVWTTQDERYLFVTVAGMSEDRDELLTMIRGTLFDLFLDYRGLQVTEQHEHEGNWVPRSTLEKFGVLEPDPQTAKDDPMDNVLERKEGEP